MCLYDKHICSGCNTPKPHHSYPPIERCGSAKRFQGSRDCPYDPNDKDYPVKNYLCDRCNAKSQEILNGRDLGIQSGERELAEKKFKRIRLAWRSLRRGLRNVRRPGVDDPSTMEPLQLPVAQPHSPSQPPRYSEEAQRTGNSTQQGQIKIIHPPNATTTTTTTAVNSARSSLGATQEALAVHSGFVLPRTG
ncbi:hypothetical protein MMC13_000224 [Lambiella insularis]|nr:hypothetical protein [Lambiella insularis]